MNFTQEQLKAGFELVENKTHWKNRINSMCFISEIPLISEAVIHFTSTSADFGNPITLSKKKGRFNKGDVVVTVQADGYRNGPCGEY